MAERYTDDDGGVTYASDRHRVEEHVREALAAAGIGGLDVVCIDAEVTLTGVVPSADVRAKALEKARGVLGVRDVVDRMVVG